jgi:dihydrofolate reductase
MVASLDGFIARGDGAVDWLETHDEYAAGETLDTATIEAFLNSIDCYVMGSRTYELALSFESRGMGWAYGDKPLFVATHRDLPTAGHPVEFWSGDLAELINGKLRPRFNGVWVVGGGVLCGDALRLGLVDEVRYSMMPIVIGAGIRFFENLGRDVPLHLMEMKAYASGMVALHYEVKR